MAHGYTSNRFVSKTNRILAGACAFLIIALSIAIATFARDWTGIAIATLGCIWLLFVVYAGLWRPRIDIDEHSVTIVNPLRTVGIPLSSLIHVDTKFSLTLITEFGRFPVACAPQPGAFAARKAAKRSTEEASSRAALDSGRRVGDIPGTESGDAAALVRDRWERYRDTHGDSAPDTDAFPPSRRRNVGTLVVMGVLPAIIVALSLIPG